VLILVLLYVLGRGNPSIMGAFVGVILIYHVLVHVIVVVAAFQEGAGTGFLTLCIPLRPVLCVLPERE
jgi:hypothetical protein